MQEWFLPNAHSIFVNIVKVFAHNFRLTFTESSNPFPLDQNQITTSFSSYGNELNRWFSMIFSITKTTSVITS